MATATATPLAESVGSRVVSMGSRVVSMGNRVVSMGSAGAGRDAAGRWAVEWARDAAGA